MLVNNTNTQLVEPGMYWYFTVGAEPQIAEISGDGKIYFCGKEASWFLSSSGERTYEAEGNFVGPIVPP